MKRTLIVVVLTASVAAGVAGTHGYWPAQLGGTGACAIEHVPSTTAAKVAQDQGPDPFMSMVCERSCAAKVDVDESCLVAQPGAKAGDLARCPVSGVVFLVHEDQSGLTIDGKTYVTCCETCVAKLRKDPGRFLSL